jgi:hypothetical protein
MVSVRQTSSFSCESELTLTVSGCQDHIRRNQTTAALARWNRRYKEWKLSRLSWRSIDDGRLLQISS